MALVSHMLCRFHPTNVDLIYSRCPGDAASPWDESFLRGMWDETGGRTPWLADLPDD